MRGRVEELAGLFRHGEIVLAGVAQVFRGVAGAREVLRRTVFTTQTACPRTRLRSGSSGSRRASHYNYGRTLYVVSLERT